MPVWVLLTFIMIVYIHVHLTRKFVWLIIVALYSNGRHYDCKANEMYVGYVLWIFFYDSPLISHDSFLIAFWFSNAATRHFHGYWTQEWNCILRILIYYLQFYLNYCRLRWFMSDKNPWLQKESKANHCITDEVTVRFRNYFIFL
jgi:hypothetical protein